MASFFSNLASGVGNFFKNLFESKETTSLLSDTSPLLYPLESTISSGNFTPQKSFTGGETTIGSAYTNPTAFSVVPPRKVTYTDPKTGELKTTTIAQGPFYGVGSQPNPSVYGARAGAGSFEGSFPSGSSGAGTGAGTGAGVGVGGGVRPSTSFTSSAAGTSYASAASPTGTIYKAASPTGQAGATVPVSGLTPSGGGTASFYTAAGGGQLPGFGIKNFSSVLGGGGGVGGVGVSESEEERRKRLLGRGGATTTAIAPNVPPMNLSPLQMVAPTGPAFQGGGVIPETINVEQLAGRGTLSPAQIQYFQEAINNFTTEFQRILAQVNAQGPVPQVPVIDTPAQVAFLQQQPPGTQFGLKQQMDQIRNTLGLPALETQRIELMRTMQASLAAYNKIVEDIRTNPELPKGLAKRRIEEFTKINRVALEGLQGQFEILNQQMSDANSLLNLVM